MGDSVSYCPREAEGFSRPFENHQIVTFQARLWVVKRKFGNGANEFPREDFSILFNNGKCAACNNA